MNRHVSDKFIDEIRVEIRKAIKELREAEARPVWYHHLSPFVQSALIPKVMAAFLEDIKEE